MGSAAPAAPLPATFAELGVAAEIVDALAERGIVRTFAIQQLTLPLALDGVDLIGQARTGMGKTYGFGVPLLDRVFDSADVAELDGTPRALVVVPTRELCVQVTDDLQRAAKNLPVDVVAIYGGSPYEPQREALRHGVDVVVGTPGRLIDLYEQGDLRLDEVAVLVIDEADEMLDLGFLPAIEKLLAALTHPHQTMLFSATMPGPVISLARSFLNQPIHIRAESPSESATQSTIRQVVFQAHRMDKAAVLAKALQAKGRGRTIIFTRTKRTAAQVAEELAERGFKVGAVHGDMAQPVRERSLGAFRTGEIEILVATDVAARGIDVDDVTHVINYQTPDDPSTYVHRIGRTGRAGHQGTAITMVGFDELPKWQAINDAHDVGLAEPPQWFSTSPELLEALAIPGGVSDRVGPPRRVFGGPAAIAQKRPRGSRGTAPRTERGGTRRRPARGERGGRGGRA